jgi:ATP-dependent Clp protease ATP-binding subunit ClpC
VQHRFHTYVRRGREGRFTVSVLTHPTYCAHSDTLKSARDELRDVLARELALGALHAGEDHWDDLQSEVVDVEIRAVQHERLIRVPMRFLVLHRDAGQGAAEVFVPTLDLRFRVRGDDERVLWTEERIRAWFHLVKVDELIVHTYARHERVESLPVTWHGAGRYKDALKERKDRDSHDAGWSSTDGELGQAGVELVQAAREARLGRALGRDRELDRLVVMLAESSGRSVVLRGPSGVGKTAIVHELAHRVLAGRVPDALEDTPIWHVTGNRLLAGLPYLGQWEQRVLRIAAQMRGNGGVLYGGDLLELCMAGLSEEGTSAATVLEGFVRDDAIRLVVECTDASWTLAERLAPGLCRLLRRLEIPAMDGDRAVDVLGTLGTRIARQQGTTLEEGALRRVFELLARFGSSDALPGSGVALVEQMVRAAPGRAVGPADAVAAFSRATGFPEVLVDPDRRLDEAELRAWFTERVVGQPEAVRALVELVLIVKAGLADPGRPLGSFLLVGPTGVGKTETARALAAWLFGDPSRMVRFDMSELAAPGSAARLVEGSGSLVARVRERPFTVVLLDEVEKADPGVFDVLLQVLDEGRLTDGSGRLVSLRHCILLMTSNLGAAASRPIGPQDAPDIAQRYRSAAEQFFRPEFVNRIGRVVPYGPLDPGSLRTIARGLLAEALAREGLVRRGVTVAFDDDVLDALVAEGTDPRYGARPLKRTLDRRVVQPLARAVAAGAPGPLRLVVCDGAVGLG